MANKKLPIWTYACPSVSDANNTGSNAKIWIIDPNQLNDNGIPVERYVAQEELMMYVEVSAYINTKMGMVRNEGEVPERYLISKNKWYSSAAKFGGIDPNGGVNAPVTEQQFFTTDWTKMFDENKPTDTEGFGIKNIDIEFNASLVPKVHIEFIDIRGKNLLEKGDHPDNPYNVFYMFPYPLFQLTVKGFFGKAISMPLVMEKAITRFDPGSGSYVISADFRSWTFAILNDMMLYYAMIVPFMFKLQSTDGSSLTYEYEGQKYVDDVYNRYHLSHPNTLDKISIIKMFKLGTMATSNLASNPALQDNIASYNSAAAIYRLILDFKAGLESAKALPTNNAEIQASWVNSQIFSVTNLITKELDTLKAKKSTLDYKPILDKYFVATNFESLDANDQVASDAFKGLANPLLDYIKQMQSVFSETIKTLYEQTLQFIPNLRNVITVVILHLQAFIELLADKTQKIFDVVLDPNAKSIKKSEAENKFELIELAGNFYRRMPWPEYYTEVKTGSQYSTQLPGYIKNFPGNDIGNPDVIGWGEVQFINEMYLAFQRAQTAFDSMSAEGVQIRDVYISTPLSIPSNVDVSNLLASGKDIPLLLRESTERMLAVVTHNGTMFRAVSDSNRDAISFQIATNDMSNILSTIDNERLAALYTMYSSFIGTGSPFANLMSKLKKDYSGEYNKLKDIGGGNSQVSLSRHLQEITKSHTYRVGTEQLPNDQFKTNFSILDSLRVWNNLPIDTTLYGTTKDDASRNVNINVYDFNYPTFIGDSEVLPLTYNNSDYRIKDLFLARKYE